MESLKWMSVQTVLKRVRKRSKGLPTFPWVNIKVDPSRVPSIVRRGKGEVASAETSMVDLVMVY
jgi:hypothetical protein